MQRPEMSRKRAYSPDRSLQSFHGGDHGQQEPSAGRPPRLTIKKRAPLIIHTYSPEVLQAADAHSFMRLVQGLTGRAPGHAAAAIAAPPSNYPIRSMSRPTVPAGHAAAASPRPAPPTLPHLATRPPVAHSSDLIPTPQSATKLSQYRSQLIPSPVFDFSPSLILPSPSFHIADIPALLNTSASPALRHYYSPLPRARPLAATGTHAAGLLSSPFPAVLPSPIPLTSLFFVDLPRLSPLLAYPSMPAPIHNRLQSPPDHSPLLSPLIRYGIRD